MDSDACEISADMSENLATSSGLVFIDVDTTTVKNEKSPTEAGLDKFSCIECKFTTRTSDLLNRHIRTKHRGEKPFQCDKCDYATVNCVMYKEHMNGHRGIKPYKCSHCAYRSVSKKYIKMHELKHGTCECGFWAKNQRALLKHKRESNCHNDEPELSCQNCKMTFESPENLKNHVKYHKQCKECEKFFIPEVLKEHVKTFHMGQPQSSFKFQCKVCQWTSNVDRKILLHLIHHPDQVVSQAIDISPLVKSGILVGHC